MGKLWGGRFAQATDQAVEAFTHSIRFDQTLAKYDCIGSLLHIRVLRRAGLLTESEHTRLRKGLEALKRIVEQGRLSEVLDPSCEDVHSFIQQWMEARCGAAALKLHTCRSRNDQVVFAVKLYCLDHIERIRKRVEVLREALKDLARRHEGLILPGYTHLQHAIPVRLATYTEAYRQMLMRDDRRFRNAGSNIPLTLGSGALAGTFIPARHYRFPEGGDLPCPVEPPVSPLDTVSDRDFIVEILAAAAVTGMHLSRMAEDWILWASREFDFVEMDDAYCTGSSLMPQKKNPDVPELVRGASGRLYGDLISVLVMMKGLPLSYDRDMQHDKEPLFDAVNLLEQALDVMTGLCRHLRFKPEPIKKQLADESLYATDIADHLVREGVPFKEAHHIVGRLVRATLEVGRRIADLPDEELRSIHPGLDRRILGKIMDPAASVRAKRSIRAAGRKG